ncbi:MAG TPA: tetratricopeptide repeat protein [Thermoanaerobaculia bacterium]
MSEGRESTIYPFRLFRRKQAANVLEPRARVEALKKLSVRARRAAIDRDPLNRTAEVLTMLLDEAHEELDRTPKDALALTTLVLHALETACTGTEVYEPVLQARAWKVHSQALLVVRSPREALPAIRRAASLIGSSSNYPIEHANITLTEGLVHGKAANYSAALCCIAAASGVYEACGDTARANMALLIEGATLYDQSQFHRAEETFRRSLEIAEGSGDAATAARAYNNLAACATKRNDPGTAAGWYRRAIEGFETCGMTAEVQRATLNLAEVMAQEQRAVEAIAELTKAREAFVARGMPLDAAEVTLKLVELLAANGRTRAAASLAAGIVKLFSDAGMQKEALLALAYVKDDTLPEDTSGAVIPDEVLQEAVAAALIDPEQLVRDVVEATLLPEEDVRRHVALLRSLSKEAGGKPHTVQRLFDMWRRTVAFRIVESTSFPHSREVLAGIPGVDAGLKIARTHLKRNPYSAATVADHSPVRLLRVHETESSPALRVYYTIDEDDTVRLLQVELWEERGADV